MWYLRKYQKGKALGGGIAAGFAQAQKDYFRFLRLVWPMTTHQLMVTDRGRVLLATHGMLGGLNDKEAHERSAVRISNVVEQQATWLMKMNPLMNGTNLTTFIATLDFPSRNLKLSNISGDLLNALNT